MFRNAALMQEEKKELKRASDAFPYLASGTGK